MDELQPTVADIEGRINNFIDVSDFVPYIGGETNNKHFINKYKQLTYINIQLIQIHL